MRRCLFFFAFLTVLLPHVGHAASAERTSPPPSTFSTPEVAELDAALARLAEAIRYKVEQDLDTIGYAFWAVHDIDRARRPADIAGAPLAALQAWLSWMRTIDSFERVFDAGGWGALGDELLNDATSGTAWLSTAVKLMHFRSLRKAGEDMARGLYGPSYADSIRRMYDEAGRQRSEDAFATVVKDYLRGQRDVRFLAVVPPEAARERGASGVFGGSAAVVASIEEAINLRRGRLIDLSPGELADEVALAAVSVDEFSQFIKRSVFQNLPFSEPSDGRPATWLGSIHGLRQMQIDLLGRYAASLRRQQVEVAFSAATSAASGLIEMSLKLGAAEPHAVMTVIDLAELGAGAASWSAEVDVRELLSEVPQSMVWALATELEILWRMVEQGLLGGIDDGIAEMVAAQGELVELAEANCREGLTEILAGQMACGVGLSREARLHVNDTPITESLLAFGTTPIEKITAFQRSPSSRYVFITTGFGIDYVVDTESKTAFNVYVGRYGPHKGIFRDDAESYALLSSSRDGPHTLHTIRLSDGEQIHFPNHDSRFGIIFDFESINFESPNMFSVRTAICKEEYCEKTEFPDDFTLVIFEIVEGNLIVRAIDDLSKVPVDLARMIAPAPDSTTPPADAAAADVAIPEDRIELDDGTVIVGAAGAVSLPFVSAFGTLEIATGEIAGFAEETLILADGSVLKGRFGDDVLPVETARGKLEVPASRVVAITRSDAATAVVVRPHVDEQAALPTPVVAVLTGQVLDNFEKPLPGAKVQIVGSALETQTDAQGRYELPYVPGSFKVAIRRDGYDSHEFNLDLTAASNYPVETKKLVKHPPRSGFFFWGKEDWIRVNQCSIRQVERDHNDFVRAGVNRFVVEGQPTLVVPWWTETYATFLDQSGARHDLMAMSGKLPALYAFAVSEDGTFLRQERAGGWAGFGGMQFDATQQGSLAFGRPMREHSLPVTWGHISYATHRKLVWHDFAPGLYAFVSPHMDYCFLALITSESAIEQERLERELAEREHAERARLEQERQEREREEADTRREACLATPAADCLLQLARDTTTQIEDPHLLAESLIAIASAHSAGNQHDSAVNSANAALRAARRVNDAELRIGLIRDIAGALASVKRADLAWRAFDDAIVEVGKLDASNRDWRLQDMAVAQAEAGQVDAAYVTARKVADAFARSTAFEGIALTLAQAGQAEAAGQGFQAAIREANSIQNASSRENRLSYIARAQGAVGHVDAALQTVRPIVEPGPRAEALASIAPAQVAAGQRDLARRGIEEALANARRIENSGRRDYFLKEIVAAQARIGLLEDALRTAGEIATPWARAHAMEAIARAQAAAGQDDAAGRSFETALGHAREIEPKSRGGTIGQIAQAQAAAGHFSGALAAARSIEDQATRQATLARIAAGRAEAKQINDALAAASEIDVADQRSLVMVDVVLAHARAGAIGAATGIARELEPAPHFAAQAYASIAGVMATPDPAEPHDAFADPTVQPLASDEATGDGNKPEVTLATVDATAPVESDAKTEMILALRSNANANVRSRAERGAEILGVLPAQTVIAVTQVAGETGWHEVNYRGRQGYVADFLLEALTDPASLSEWYGGEFRVLDTSTIALPRAAKLNLPLHGIDGLGGDHADRMNAFIREQGSRVECEQVVVAEFRCRTAGSGIDLAQVALLNGAARTIDGAPDEYLTAEQQAREARRGIWANAH